MKKIHKRTYWLSALSVAALLVGTQAYAGHPTGQSVVLKNHLGIDIPVGSTEVFSFRQTCNGGCHRYEEVEPHMFHSQLGANEFMGWDAHKYGNWNSISSAGLPWSQSPGHIGKW
jgi:hypothetical protein